MKSDICLFLLESSPFGPIFQSQCVFSRHYSCNFINDGTTLARSGFFVQSQMVDNEYIVTPFVVYL